jgi:DNA-binding Lrp family transcriptional regulator
VAKSEVRYELNRHEKRSSDFETTPVFQTLLKTSAFLCELQDGPEYKPVLADRLGVSKSTVYNWARELLRHEIIEKSATGYRLTATGRAQIALFTRWQNASQRIHLLESLLVSIPDDQRPPEQLFWNARVLSGTEKITTTLGEWLHETTLLRGLAPKTIVESVRTVNDAFDLNPNVVVEPRSFGSDEVKQDIEDNTTPTRTEPDVLDVSLREVEEPFPFTLLIRVNPDPALAIVLYNNEGYADRLLSTGAETAFQWGLRVYDHYQT